MKAKKSRLLIVVSIFLIALVFVGAEIILRACGKQPIKLMLRDRQNEPKIFEKDHILGWKAIPGVYDQWPASWDGNSGIKVTIWPDGSRATGPVAVSKDRQIICVGCSYTFGWAIPDKETYVWKLQEQFPEIEFVNYGMGGYGSYQSLLVLEKHFQNHPDSRPVMVMYGFGCFHEERNVASADWLRRINISNRFTACLPYCQIDNNSALERKRPVMYRPWVLSRYSVVVDRIQILYIRMLSYQRSLRKEEVTKELIKEMNALCESRGVMLVVLIMDKGGLRYRDFLSGEGIRFIDLVPSYIPPGGYKVKNEGHPNVALNSYWASAIADFIRREYKFTAGKN